MSATTTATPTRPAPRKTSTKEKAILDPLKDRYWASPPALDGKKSKDVQKEDVRRNVIREAVSQLNATNALDPYGEDKQGRTWTYEDVQQWMSNNKRGS